MLCSSPHLQTTRLVCSPCLSDLVVKHGGMQITGQTPRCRCLLTASPLARVCLEQFSRQFKVAQHRLSKLDCAPQHRLKGHSGAFQTIALLYWATDCCRLEKQRGNVPNFCFFSPPYLYHCPYPLPTALNYNNLS